MKTLILIFLATTAFATGPKNSFKDPRLNDEFNNVYHDIDSPNAADFFTSRTLAQIKTITPKRAGIPFYCSDCATDAVCVSSGTGTGAFTRVSARTTACQ